MLAPFAVRINGACKANRERRGGDSNANAVWIDGSSTHGDRVNDLVDEDIAKQGQEVLVGDDVGARDQIDKEGGRVSEGSCIKGVHLSGGMHQESRGDHQSGCQSRQWKRNQS